jgi:hypothetical protein
MAKSHYNADSAPLPLPRLLYLVRSDVIGACRALIGDCGNATAGEAFPTIPSTIG